MEPGKLKLLEEKYWAGETDAQEEEQLKSYVAERKIGLSQELIALITASNTYAAQTTSPDFDEKFWNRVEGKNKGNGVLRWLQFSTMLKYAAAIVVIGGIGLAIYSITVKIEPNNTTTAVTDEFHDTYTDPQQAYEETKRALLMVSSKLNEAEQPVMELKRFHESKMSITGGSANKNN
jgi:hypothetical protein